VASYVQWDTIDRAEVEKYFARIEIPDFGCAFILIADPYQISFKTEVTEVL
jgi:hypothetical protein